MLETKKGNQLPFEVPVVFIENLPERSRVHGIVPESTANRDEDLAGDQAANRETDAGRGLSGSRQHCPRRRQRDGTSMSTWRTSRRVTCKLNQLSPLSQPS